MIWFFLMGMVAGAAGVIMVLCWWFRTHMTKLSRDEFLREIENTEEEKSDD